MVTDGQRVAAVESIAQGVATTVLTLGWFTAWEESEFTLATPLTPPVQSPGTAAMARTPYRVLRPIRDDHVGIRSLSM